MCELSNLIGQLKFSSTGKKDSIHVELTAASPEGHVPTKYKFTKMFMYCEVSSYLVTECYGNISDTLTNWNYRINFRDLQAR